MDKWMQHLENHGLLGLHEEAQQVGFRVRTANDWNFTLEYEGGLEKYYQHGNALREYENTDEGKGQARVYLAEVQADIDEYRAIRKQQVPECPEGYFWNGRQCLRENPWPALSIYEREGF